MVTTRSGGALSTPQSKRTRPSVACMGRLHISEESEGMARGNVGNLIQFWIPHELAARLQSDHISVDYGPVNEVWLPDRDASLCFRGYVFRASDTTSLISAGGMLFEVPTRLEVGDEMHVTFATAPAQ